MATAKPLHVRAFLEGYEIPVISVSVSIGINAPAACSVQVIPLDSIMRLRPRTMIHVFYLDSDLIHKKDGSVVQDENYRLLFAGETVGYSYVQTPQSRGLVLQCVDFSSYWDCAHAMAMEFGPNGNAFRNQMTTSSGVTAPFDDIIHTQPDRLASWIRQKPLTPSLKTVSGLAGGIIRMMEVIGGITSGESSQHHKGLNDFFTVANLKVRLLNQITAEEKDSTAANILGGAVFDQWLKNGLQNIGQQVTFRDMMLLLMRYIYYDFVPNPAAKFDPGTGGQTAPAGTVKLKNLPGIIKARGFVSKAQIEAIKLIEFVENQNVIETLVPTVSNILDFLDSAKSEVDDVQAAYPTLGFTPKDIQNMLDRAADVAKRAAPETQEDTTPRSVTVDEVRPLLPLLQNAQNIMTDTDKGVRFASTIAGAEAQRLHTHIIRPDCWFAPAPVCNVIFPELYTQFSNDRVYTGEVTRLILTSYTSVIGPDPNHITNDVILAPHLSGQFIDQLIRESNGTRGYQLLLDHELHTGIVPRSEWLPNTSARGTAPASQNAKTPTGDKLNWMSRVALYHFFKYRFAPRRASVAGRFNPFPVCGFPGVIIRRPFFISDDGPEFIREFQAEVGKTKEVTNGDFVSAISAAAVAFKAPMQLIGMIDSVQHSIGQDGGSTAVTFNSIRPHKGNDDDFFDVFLESKGNKTKRLIRTDINFADALGDNSTAILQRLSDITPQNLDTAASTATRTKKKTKTVSLKDAPRSVHPNAKASRTGTATQVEEDPAQTQSSPIPPLCARGDIAGTQQKGVLVPASPPRGKFTIGKKGRYGGIVKGVRVNANGRFVTDPVFKNVFESVTVYEEVEVVVDTTIPLEGVIKPDWFSSAYENHNIGTKIYQPFFGCDSVVDRIRVTGTGDPGLSVDDSHLDGLTVSATKTPDEVIADLVETENLKASTSIEKSVNVLSYIYGQVRQQSLDVDDFIRQYIDRPIATMVDIFGQNLDYTVSGTKATAVKQKGADGVTDRPGDLIIGFHSAAVSRTLAEAGKLAGLMEDPTTQLRLINDTGKADRISDRFDVREAKQKRVRDYLTEFNDTRGFRG